MFGRFAGGRRDGPGGRRGAEFGAGLAARGGGFVGGELDVFAFFSWHGVERVP